MFEFIRRLIFCDFYNRPRVLNEDLLILILDYLPIDDLIEFKKVSPQFSYCVKELLKRKKILIVCYSKRGFQSLFYFYHEFSQIEQNIETLRNSVIHFKQIERNICLKYLYKRCIHLNVLAINEPIEYKKIQVLKKFSKRVDTLCLAFSSIWFNDIEEIVTDLEKIGTIFGNTIKSLNLRFSKFESYINDKIIVLLKSFPTLKEFKVNLKSRIDDIVEYIPKTLQVLDTSFGYFQNAIQYRQHFKDMIQRIENKFTVFRMYYPLDEELLQLLSNKLDAKNFAIKLSEIPIEYVFQMLSYQRYLRRLIISYRFYVNLSGEYRFSRVKNLGLLYMKVNEQSFKTLIECFPNISSLFLTNIEFICDCNHWSTLCFHRKYQFVDVLTKLVYLKKLELNEYKTSNFRISCESLEKFKNLCRINVFTKNSDIEDLIENVIEFCAKRPQSMFYLEFYRTPEEIIELFQNIPKNLSIKKIF